MPAFNRNMIVDAKYRDRDVAIVKSHSMTFAKRTILPGILVMAHLVLAEMTHTRGTQQTHT